MQNIYTHKKNFTGSTVTLTGDEHHHATRSCRVKIGEVICVTDGCGKRVEARIISIDSHSLTAEVGRDISGAGEPACEITVALSMIKPSRFEIAIEKCTELGAVRFVPLITERCTVKPGGVRLDRLRKIACEAARQSGRSLIPEIIPPVDIMEYFSYGESYILVAAASATMSMEKALKSITGRQAFTLAIGPEGDFTGGELKHLTACGAVLFSLGGLTLITETAAITATALAVNTML